MTTAAPTTAKSYLATAQMEAGNRKFEALKHYRSTVLSLSKNEQPVLPATEIQAALDFLGRSEARFQQDVDRAKKIQAYRDAQVEIEKLEPKLDEVYQREQAAEAERDRVLAEHQAKVDELYQQRMGILRPYEAAQSVELPDRDDIDSAWYEALPPREDIRLRQAESDVHGLLQAMRSSRDHAKIAIADGTESVDLARLELSVEQNERRIKFLQPWADRYTEIREAVADAHERFNESMFCKSTGLFAPTEPPEAFSVFIPAELYSPPTAVGIDAALGYATAGSINLWRESNS